MDNKKLKRLVFVFGLASLIAACGGGGGGSSTPIREDVVIEVPKDTTEFPEEKYRDFTPQDLSNIVHAQEDEIGSGYKIAIMDSDFTNSNNPLIKSYVENSFISEALKDKTVKGNKDPHGQHVLKILTKDTGFKVTAVTLGTKDENNRDTIMYSFDDYKKILNILKNQKVKIINQSFGSNEISENENEQILAYREILRNDDVLFVWANGNTKENTGSVESSYPKKKDSLLEKGWITVIGIDPNTNAHYNKISSGQNHLSYAKGSENWAISAPANGEIGWGRFGSSYAAPKVSRAAALVASEYPWMTNNQIRETLFTTTDKPEQLNNERSTSGEPNEKYGWGILNTKRALKGPGAFWKRLLEVDKRNKAENENYYFTANVTEGNYYFSNDIIGDSGLIKDGPGVLGLLGNNSYEGNTIIKKGILDIYRKNSSSIKVKENGELGLHEGSSIEKNIFNNGKVFITGKTFVNKYKCESKDSKTTFLIDNNALLKGNQLELNGEIGIISEKYEPISKKKVIEGKNLKGEFTGCETSISINGMRDVNIIIDGNKVFVELQRKKAENYLLSKDTNLLATSSKLEKILEDTDQKLKTNNITSSELEKGTALINMDAKTFTRAVERMTGEVYASSQNMSFLQSQKVNRILSNHLYNIDDINNNQGWIEMFGSKGKIKKDGFASMDTKIRGSQFGIDKKLTPNRIIGTSIAYSYGKFDFDKNIGQVQSDSVGISLYGKEKLSNNYYVSGRIGATRFSNRTQRELIDFNGNVVRGDMKHHDNMLSSYIELGKNFNLITPYIGYGIDYLDRGNFKERNETWGLEADSKTYVKQNMYLGVRGEYSLNNYKLNGYIEHIINISDRDLDFEGKYIGSNIKFNFEGIGQVKNTSYMGFGISKKVNEEFSINTNLDLKFEKDKLREKLISVGVEYRF